MNDYIQNYKVKIKASLIQSNNLNSLNKNINKINFFVNLIPDL